MKLAARLTPHQAAAFGRRQAARVYANPHGRRLGCQATIQAQLLGAFWSEQEPAVERIFAYSFARAWLDLERPVIQ